MITTQFLSVQSSRMQCVSESCLQDFDLCNLFLFICVDKKKCFYWFCRWLLTPQTRRMSNPQGPKTEKESAVAPESGIANPLHLVNVTALVIGIALNLLKGNVKLCFF